MADTREKLNCLTVKHQHEADNLSDAARKACGDDGTVSTFKWMHSLAAAHKEFVSELDDIACLLENGVTVLTEDEQRNVYTVKEIEEIQGEAYDLGAESVLHNHFGLSWHDAEKVRKEVAQLRDAQKWIPVTERLPKPGERVLVCIGAVFEAFIDDGGKWQRYYSAPLNEVLGEPTHWMPLPQPPKEG